MKLKRGGGDIVWTVAGAGALLAVVWVVLHFQKDPAAQLAFNARRVDLVGRMELDVASAAEAEKSAVLAATDEDAKTFADQARAASGRVEQERRELEGLLSTGVAAGERELLAQFTGAFVELQHIDDDLLSLAVQNTNVKAYSLAFGPAADALGDMNAALARLATANASSPEGKTILTLATGAEISALRIQTLLPPHIAEESDAKMDALEARMAAEDAHVKKNLRDLAALPKVGKNPDLAIAATRYSELTDIRTKILALSRANTNVRSLSMSLNQKRKVMRICQGTLSALQQAILAEPIAGSANGSPIRPR
jgi:hypothetical protein